MFKFSGSKLSDFDNLLPKPGPIRFHRLDPHVISLICDELQEGASMALDRQWRTNEHLACRKGLLSLAVAAKVFTEPGLNGLWRVLSTVEPLLSVLPETTTVDGKKMLVRQIAPASWDRLRFYTSRVHEFDQRSLSEAEVASIHDSVYARLGQMQPIFPSLEVFHPATSICGSNSLLFFLADTIVTASLPTLLSSEGSQPEEGTDFGPSLALLAWKAPQIQTLHLDAEARYSGFSASISCFSELQELRVAQLSRYDTDFMSSIASLSKLSYLSLSFPPKSSLNFKCITTHGFTSVKKLHIAGSPGELNQLLMFIPPPVLDELKMTFNPASSSWQENKTEMTSLARSLDRFSSISTLDIASITEIDMTRLDGNFLWSLFAPLLRLKNLRRLSYDLPLLLTDQKTVEIAKAWPEMEVLTLTSETWGDTIPSIASLSSFVNSCPKLISLEYPIQVNFPGAGGVAEAAAVFGGGGGGGGRLACTPTPTTSTGFGGKLPSATTPFSSSSATFFPTTPSTPHLTLPLPLPLSSSTSVPSSRSQSSALRPQQQHQSGRNRTRFSSAASSSSLSLSSPLLSMARSRSSLQQQQQQQPPLPPPPPPPAPTLKMHPLKSFRCTLYEDVRDPAVVALHLYQIFPGLLWAEGNGRRWSEVQAILDTFHFLTRQNRRME
ncbi:hypothetical protein D9757_006952 [Collybiopsis confluens]|uniref:Uncharacterized protein n=1 Tax=Collybiopsis confluens TaxID=2823264 RepID=A0A8H5HII2_9AGAR|nr:hypothetical protein D9757_006952 [Collybiopsis confluens]